MPRRPYSVLYHATRRGCRKSPSSGCRRQRPLTALRLVVFRALLSLPVARPTTNFACWEACAGHPSTQHNTSPTSRSTTAPAPPSSHHPAPPLCMLKNDFASRLGIPLCALVCRRCAQNDTQNDTLDKGTHAYSHSHIFTFTHIHTHTYPSLTVQSPSRPASPLVLAFSCKYPQSHPRSTQYGHLHKRSKLGV
jgi:hypothetical protein